MQVQNINNFYHNSASTNFTGWTTDLAKETRGLVKQAKKLAQEKADSSSLDRLERELSQLDAKLKDNLGQAKSDIKGREKPVSGIYVGLVKAIEKLTGGSKSAGDVASAVTSVVLWGNVLKEAVGTTLYTIQALTNEDLPKDKRRFVGAYDLGVGVTSTIISFVLGVGFQDLIKSGYKKMLKGIKGVNPKYEAVLEGLSAFTSFGLQTIVGKRILAPLVGVPVAGKLRSKMEERDAKKRGEVSMQGQPQPAEQTVKSDAYPTNKYGYVDLKTYVARVKEQQAKEAAEKAQAGA